MGQDWLPKTRVAHFGNTLEQNISGASYFRQDSVDRILIEGYHGTATYDGNSFIIDEKSPSLSRKLIDTDGDYWYGGSHGKLMVKKANGSIVDSTSIKPYIDRNVNSIHQDQDRFFYITSPYNETAAAFSSKIGIKLTEIGSYALKTSTIKAHLYIMSFDTQSPSGSLLLTTNIANSDEEGIYRFTVE